MRVEEQEEVLMAASVGSTSPMVQGAVVVVGRVRVVVAARQARVGIASLQAGPSASHARRRAPLYKATVAM